MNKGFQVFGGTVNIGSAAAGDDAHAEGDEVHLGRPEDESAVPGAQAGAGAHNNDLSGTADAVVQARNIGVVTMAPGSSTTGGSGPRRRTKRE
jgi:hypothetical protein